MLRKTLILVIYNYLKYLSYNTIVELSSDSGCEQCGRHHQEPERRPVPRAPALGGADGLGVVLEPGGQRGEHGRRVLLHQLRAGGAAPAAAAGVAAGRGAAGRRDEDPRGVAHAADQLGPRPARRVAVAQGPPQLRQHLHRVVDGGW